MQERLLHFIWQYQYFSPSTLSTPSGMQVHVRHPGEYNVHAGPDFLFASLVIEGMEWRGHVEIHVKASDWEHHNHHHDPAYDAVILHVVWENDKTVYRSEGSVILTIALEDRISLSVFRRYGDLSRSLWHIPCSDYLSRVNRACLDEASVHVFKRRVDKRVRILLNMLKRYQGDWEELAFRHFMTYAGGGQNKGAFARLAGMLPYRLLLRHADRQDQVEALFLGTAGFLPSKSGDVHGRKLNAEFRFLRQKYTLPVMKLHEWKFLRMRPANFPTRRLAGIAAFLCHRKPLFSRFIHCSGPEEAEILFRVDMGYYWKDHYHFGKQTRQMSAITFGREMIHSLHINVILPLQAAYHSWHGLADDGGKIMEQYRNIPPENNKYIRLWKEAGITAESAYDSQALLELFREDCLERRCLDCPVGQGILGMKE